MLLTYDQYIDKWDEIENIFSLDAIRKGSFDKYIESNKKKKGTAEVDEVFLEQMEAWRKSLAKNIAIRNPNLSIRELNYSVQKTIDRIIFLRICEDRGIEDYGQLMALQNGANVYDRLKQIFYRADEKYNSGLFHFEKERDRIEPPDNLTLDLTIDDKTIKDIVKELYYPDSPYEFSVLPADILGQVYEQFLGKVIRLTPAHHAEVEDKPEVKKAGGVYYTPTYIVDYIVNNTVGKILKKIPSSTEEGSAKPGVVLKKISALKILDPACGSGSFLLGAYQYLLDWHLKYYLKEIETSDRLLKQKQPPVYINDKGVYLLTTSEKKRILLNNIYGVDIDPQAVEVTKLSLMLKVLEGESTQTLSNELQFFRERALPDLSNNIKCGNSLIGPDFYNQTEMNFLDDEEKLRINVFDWHKEFPQVFKTTSPSIPLLGKEREEKGEVGFDVVIGNPPYIRIQGRGESEANYFNHGYKSATGNYDIYCMFIEKAISLLSKVGISGMIVPHRFFKVDYGLGLRDLIYKQKLIERIFDFDGYMVFDKASINTAIVILNKFDRNELNYSRIKNSSLSKLEIIELLNDNKIKENLVEHGEVSYINLSEAPWSFIMPHEESIWKKLKSIDQYLETISNNIFQGLKTGSDGYFIADIIDETSKYFNCYFSGPDKNYLIEKELMYPLIKGGEIKRYIIKETVKRILFPYKKGKLISESEIQLKFPKAWIYLTEQKPFLSDREKGKMKHLGWYGYTRTQALENIFLKKIITPEYYSSASYSFDEQGNYMFCGGGAGGYAINLKNSYSYEYILGLLNSKLLDWYLKKISMRAYQTAYMYTKKYISQLPIATVLKDDLKYSSIERLVKQNLILHTKASTISTPTERTAIERQIQATDTQIDQLVYQLYGLTEEEIKIVEGNA